MLNPTNCLRLCIASHLPALGLTRINLHRIIQKKTSKLESEWILLEFTPAVHPRPFAPCGAYYVQEAGSMFVGTIIKELLKTTEIKTALDLCAAPGGKTTDMASVLDKDTFILANEPIKIARVYYMKM